MQQLWREIKAKVYLGSDNGIYRWLSTFRDKSAHLDNQESIARDNPICPNNEIMGIGRDLPSAKQLSKLLMQPSTCLNEEQGRIISYICQDALVNQVYNLSQQFVIMINQRAVEKLDDWISQCKASPIAIFAQFALRFEQDYAAIRAALTTEWSSGQTEGQVNRLKLIKRQMYGRANFDLMRLRVLYKM